MTNKLKTLLNTFGLNFQDWYEFTRYIIKKEKERGTWNPEILGTWVDTLSIFYALESCKSVVGENNTCRFSKRALSKKDLNTLLWHLNHNRAVRYRRGSKSKINYVKEVGDELSESEARRKLSEFMVDFSISNYPIPLTYKDENNVDDLNLMNEIFKFQLIAESELHTKVNDIYRDCLKLTQISADYKIMLFRTGKETLAKNRKKAFERLLTNSLKEEDNAEWLFIGLPSFVEWELKFRERKKLPVIIFTFKGPKPDDGKVKLDNKSEMWKWN
ncbi:hypothetical protein FYZ48_11035 [Gimesia chilikensis]|uniref:hypothetical protein n=1 Tax=Gimesia chilikensis TaxID=2605989 RepID=UPI0011EFC297|nr:hypothetical protein [Gimesia chilikensis]KAA0139167.1 hypothetical protein FYZ48_11035 [Gimesia chilikensis]